MPNKRRAVTVSDQFWNGYSKLVQDKMLPYQWDVLHDRAEITIESEREDPNIPTVKSHVIANFLIAAGKKEGHHYGWLFQDSDLYKWLEGAAQTYRLNPDPNLLAMMEEAVQIIADAQEEDGYISTYYQIEAPQLKFRRLFESHELYCAGHLIEAAIAYDKATASKDLLEIAYRLIKCIDMHFGAEEGKINGADGHQEIELALVHLYEHTGESYYLELSRYFLHVRGQDVDFYKKQLIENNELGLDDRAIPHIGELYLQAHKPVAEQAEAVGHAVRMVYMAEAMASTGHYLSDPDLLQPAKKIWENITNKRMYITGGIGSTVRGEAFTYDYDLPTDLMYCETCASIGLINFAHALQKVENRVDYADVMERALYNGMISGMSRDGKRFFYVNPLEVDPEASRLNPDKSHVKSSRPSWFGCACCPPNLARTIPRIHDYIYNQTNDQTWINQWIDSQYEDENLTIIQSHDLKAGQSCFTITSANEKVIAIRIPYWVDQVTATLAGSPIAVDREKGYFFLTVSGDNELVLDYQVNVLKWQSHPKVKSSYGKVAFQHGPFIYTAEEIDNEKDLYRFTVNGQASTYQSNDPILGPVTMIKVSAEKTLSSDDEANALYNVYREEEKEQTNVHLIPYHLWANRGLGEMRVWLNQK